MDIFCVWPNEMAVQEKLIRGIVQDTIIFIKLNVDSWAGLSISWIQIYDL